MNAPMNATNDEKPRPSHINWNFNMNVFGVFGTISLGILAITLLRAYLRLQKRYETLLDRYLEEKEQARM